ncbi:MAG: hypothetical protein EP330_23355 [Deltaproteobacteria bacterium]|nr:MAG: hypothetical protein EP330_23355 [Deltaproteobacteria bacterium]
MTKMEVRLARWSMLFWPWMLAACEGNSQVCDAPEIVLDVSGEVSTLEVGVGPVFTLAHERATVEGTVPLCVRDRRSTRGYVQENALSTEMVDLPPIELTVGDVRLESTGVTILNLFEVGAPGEEYATDFVSVVSRGATWLVDGEEHTLSFELDLEDPTAELVDIESMAVNPGHTASGTLRLGNMGSLEVSDATSVSSVHP